MKKLNYLLAAVAVMAMAGCAKEKDVTPASETVKLHVTVDDTDTRVSIDNAYAFAFQSGDVISVLTDGGHPVEFVASEGGTSVDFSGTFEQGQAIGSYAMYPACEDHIADGDYMFFNIPEELTWRADESFMPMLGKINGGATTFKAVGGVLKLIVYNIPATAEYLQFDAQGHSRRTTISAPAPTIMPTFPASNPWSGTTPTRRRFPSGSMSSCSWAGAG